MAAANAAAAVAAAAAQLAAPPPAIPQPVVYVWPGIANVQALDYTKTSDIKMFLRGIEALSSKFDLQAGQLKVF
jgi:hypothetical protein